MKHFILLLSIFAIVNVSLSQAQVKQRIYNPTEDKVLGTGNSGLIPPGIQYLLRDEFNVAANDTIAIGANIARNGNFDTLGTWVAKVNATTNNGNFETWSDSVTATGWTLAYGGVEGTVERTTGYSGSYAAVLYSADYFLLKGPVVTSGKVCRVRGRFKTNNANNTFVWFMNGSNLDFTINGTVGAWGTVDTTYVSDGYNVAPGQDSGDSLWIDDLEVTDITDCFASWNDYSDAGAIVDTCSGVTGSAVKLTRVNTNTPVVNQENKLTIGQHYKWTAWVKKISGTPELYFYDDDNAYAITATSSSWTRQVGSLVAGGTKVSLFNAANGSSVAVDDFTIEPSGVSGTYATDGVNLRTVTDTEGKLSLTSSNLSFSGGKASAAWGDPLISYPAQARVAGKTLIGQGTKTSGTITGTFGWSTDAGSLPYPHRWTFVLATQGYVTESDHTSSIVIDDALATITQGETYTASMALRTAGAFYFVKGGTEYTSPTLLWIGKTNSLTPLYPDIVNYDGVVNFNFLRIPRTAWLPTPLASDGFGTGSEKYMDTLISPTIANGGFETAGAGGADPLASWYEAMTAASTVTRDTVVKYSGSASAQFFVDADESYLLIDQSVLTLGEKYRVGFMGKKSTADEISVGLGEETGANFAYSGDLTSSWASYGGIFSPVTQVGFAIKRLGAVSDTFHIDNVWLREVQLGQTDGLGHAEGIAGGLGSGGSGLAWSHGGTWSFNNAGKAINTPTLGAELHSDAGLEGTYTDGLNTMFGAGASPRYAQSADVHGGSKAQAFRGTENESRFYADRSASKNSWYISTVWAKRISGTAGDVKAQSHNNTGNASNSVAFTSASYAKYAVSHNQLLSGDITFRAAMSSTAGLSDSVVIDDISSKRINYSTLYSTVETSTADVIASADVVVTAGTQAGLVMSYADTNNLVLAYHDGTNAKLDKCVSTVKIDGTTLNGGFETAGAGGADIWANWIEDGGAAITQDTVNPHGGTAAARMTSDAGYVYQGATATAGKRYRLQTWYRTTGAARFSFYNASIDNIFPSSTQWRLADTVLTAGTTYFVFGPPIGAMGAGDTLWIDDVTVTDLQTWTSVISAAATYSAGATMTVIKDGTSYSLFYNNAKVGSTSTISDAGLVSNTKHGLFSTYSGNTLDNFLVWARGTNGEYSRLNTWSAP